MGGPMTQEEKWKVVCEEYRRKPEVLTEEIKQKFFTKTLKSNDFPASADPQFCVRNILSCMVSPDVTPLFWE